jgi:biotin carboxylase
VTATRARTFVLFEMMNAVLLVAREAKARGLRVVALNHDPLRDSGPFAVPDGLVDELVYVESWSDTAAVQRIVRDLAQRADVAGTYSVFEGALPAEALLRELAGLPTTGVRNTLRVLDKGLVRSRLYDQGLSALRSTTLDEALTWTRWRFAGPAVLKPANGTGSALCFIVSCLEELRAAAARVAAADVINPLMREFILAHGGFVLEEKAEGELLSVESLVCRGEVHVVGLTGRYVLASDPVVEQGLFFPYRHPLLAQIAAKAKALHACLEIFHGPTHLEVMVGADGAVELIDFNARVAGLASVVSFGEVFASPYERLLVDVACGIDPDLAPLERVAKYAAEVIVLPPPGVTRLEEIEFPHGTIAARAMKAPGARLTGRADQLDAVGMFIVTGDSAREAHRRAMAARRATLVNGEALGDNPNNDVVCPVYADLEGVDADGPIGTIGTAPISEAVIAQTPIPEAGIPEIAGAGRGGWS